MIQKRVPPTHYWLSTNGASTYAGRGRPDDVTAHRLRHSLAWRMFRTEEGNSLYDVRNCLRHATILTTERKYDHFETI